MRTRLRSLGFGAQAHLRSLSSGAQAVCTTVVLLLVSGLLFAQQLRLKSDVLLINVVATVVDGKGRTVPDLTADDFIVEEDGQPQAITHLLPSADLPVSIGVVLDVRRAWRARSAPRSAPSTASCR